MCVICYKESTQPMPSLDTVRNMWIHNPDGAGIMWRTEKGVSFKKGFMKLSELLEFLELNKDLFENSELAMHFRIGTSGGNTAGNCHPFVCKKNTDVHALDGVNERIVLMHNGILSLTPRAKDISDTGELAIRAGEHRRVLKYLREVDEFISPSKIVVFAPEETLFLGSPFVLGKDGLCYSNLNHTYTFRQTYTKGKWSNYSYGYSTYGINQGYLIDDDGYDEYEDDLETANTIEDRSGVVYETPPFIPQYLVCTNRSERKLAEEVIKDVAKTYGMHGMTMAEWNLFYKEYQREIEDYFYDEVDYLERSYQEAMAEEEEAEKAEKSEEVKQLTVN